MFDSYQLAMIGFGSLRLSVLENIEFLGASRRLKHHSRNMPDIDNLRISLRQSLEAQVKIEEQMSTFSHLANDRSYETNAKNNCPLSHLQRCFVLDIDAFLFTQ